MAAKKTQNGIYLYWAHNTESFAVASMTSADREPHLVMSRSKPSRDGLHDSTSCTSGGRAIRNRSTPSRPAKKQKMAKTSGMAASTNVMLSSQVPISPTHTISMDKSRESEGDVSLQGTPWA